ncbi:hypothetical protein [Corynebacterium lactis]|uniref:Uncharacterized protein n=1 Tax=Corynebacterium lactis RW2-5 TaxID=1408189 RepID=A0A0K2H326_9CORY|nr:hypothetical protein [Corynebacterium lactis]ALA68432.1 hypothetical protein CLAC_03305 [Corynebacterium lactis RW2-5]
MTLRPITAADRAQIRADYRQLRRHLSVNGTIHRITQARQVHNIVVRNVCGDLIDTDQAHLRVTRTTA